MASQTDSSRLLAQLLDHLRYRHYSPRTERAYVYWVRFFMRWHARQGHRNPRDPGTGEVQAFLEMLASRKKAAVSTRNQALSALKFLYREVLQLEARWLDDIQRPSPPSRSTSALSIHEVTLLLGAMSGDAGLLARLLHTTGIGLGECLRLRIIDVDFEKGVLAVRGNQREEDRALKLPHALVEPLRAQLDRARWLWQRDRRYAVASLPVPAAISAHDAHAGSRWEWYWVFPAPALGIDRRTGIEIRRHLSPDRLQRAIKLACAGGGIARPVTARMLSHSFIAHPLPPAPLECREPGAIYFATGAEFKSLDKRPRQGEALHPIFGAQISRERRYPRSSFP